MDSPMKEIYVKSTLDETMQPSLFWKATSSEKRPLFVGLHTWSFDRFNQVERLLPVAQQYDFHLLLPEFRGANLDTNPQCTQACGSHYAMQDVKDAIDFCIREYNVDSEHVFLFGESGGGHMALMMAGYCPEYFEAIAAVVPITDLKKWADYREPYRRHVLACCSGDEKEMAKRSPMTYIDNIAKANLKIFHGKYDPCVPYTQSVELFEEISQKYPKSRVFLDIFDGGHQTDMHEVLYWILSQYHRSDRMDVTA